MKEPSLSRSMWRRMSRRSTLNAKLTSRMRMPRSTLIVELYTYEYSVRFTPSPVRSRR